MCKYVLLVLFGPDYVRHFVWCACFPKILVSMTVLTICRPSPPYKFKKCQKLACWLSVWGLCRGMGWRSMNGFKVGPWDMFRSTKNIGTISHILWKISEHELWWKKRFLAIFQLFELFLVKNSVVEAILTQNWFT